MIERRDFLKFILLTIVTCGIYSIVFWYKLVIDINRACDGDGMTTQDYLIVFLLTILTCGIYYYIWIYQLGDRIYKNGPRYGLTISETGTTILLWTIIGNLVGIGSYLSAYFIINNTNYIFDRYNGSMSAGQYGQF